MMDFNMFMSLLLDKKPTVVIECIDGGDEHSLFYHYKMINGWTVELTVGLFGNAHT